MKKAQSDETGRAAHALHALLVVFQAAFGVMVMRQPENGKTGFQAAYKVVVKRSGLYAWGGESSNGRTG